MLIDSPVAIAAAARALAAPSTRFAVPRRSPAPNGLEAASSAIHVGMSTCGRTPMARYRSSFHLPFLIRSGGDGALSNKVWMITGAARGLGFEFARAALERGDSVVATARNTAVSYTHLTLP